MDDWTSASDIYDDKAELDGSPKEEEEEEKGCSEVRTPWTSQAIYSARGKMKTALKNLGGKDDDESVRTYKRTKQKKGIPEMIYVEFLGMIQCSA